MSSWDTEYNQYDVEKDNLGDALNYLVDGMEDLCEVTFYNETTAISHRTADHHRA